MEANYSHIYKSFTVVSSDIAKSTVCFSMWDNCQRCRENVYV